MNAAKKNPPQGAWWSSPLALVGALIVVAVVIAVIVTSGGDDSADSAPAVDGTASTEETASDEPRSLTPQPGVFGGAGIPEVDDVTVVGDRLPPFSNGGVDVAVGTMAPEITATSLATGAPVTLGAGTNRVIGVFAHWCPHCQNEVPKLARWLRENELPADTEFVAVSSSVDSNQSNHPPSKWWSRENWPTEVIVDDGGSSVLNAYGFGSFPALIAISADGVVLARMGGSVGEEGLETLFAILAEPR